jgi:phosphoglycolate phosphatase
MAAAVRRLALNPRYVTAVLTNNFLGSGGGGSAPMAWSGVLDMVDAVVESSRLGVRKPDPAPLRAVLAMLDAASCWYVGDSETDALTARAAALPFALFSGGYRKAPVADLPHDWAFDDHSTLPAWLEARAAA